MNNPGFLVTILAFILMLGPLVFLHELGHYLAGRWFGVKAEAFSIGFGHEIGGFTDKRGTRWKFGWLPLGGYVRFAGDMNPASQPSAEWLSLPAEERAKTFQSKPLWQRAIIVAAGPIANFIVAIVILAGFAFAYGDSRSIVGEIVPGSAAEMAGLQSGDRIVALDGTPVSGFQELVAVVAPRPGEQVTITITRGGETRDIRARLGERAVATTTGETIRIGQLGIGRAPVSLIGAPIAGVRETGNIVAMMGEGIGEIVTGSRSVKELGGPLAIARVSGSQLAAGWSSFLFLVALISINLGFINLLPVPILDGGHLFFYAIEGIRRRPVGPRVQEWAFRGGLLAILALMLLVTFNDLGSFGVWKNLAGLIG